MKKLSFILVAVSVVLGLSACSSESSEKINNGSNDDSVSDTTTGKPVPTVNVTPFQADSTADAGTEAHSDIKNVEGDQRKELERPAELQLPHEIQPFRPRTPRRPRDNRRSSNH